MSIDMHFVKVVEPWLRALRQYHQHRVIGLDNIPERGPALVVVNHSLATYDIFLLAAAIYEHNGRIARALGDRLLFKLPLLRAWANRLGAVEGSPDNAVSLLKQDHLVLVAPGGMREALRPSSQKYQLRWNNRLGFARVAMQAQVPIILAACPRADDLYKVYPSAVTSLAYHLLRVPLPLMRGRGLSLMPQRIELVHELSKPMMPPKVKGKVRDEDVQAFHASLMDEMKRLLERGVNRA